MTRKDYEMIAAAVADAGLQYASTPDNPRFDRKRFMAACGFDA